MALSRVKCHMVAAAAIGRSCSAGNKADVESGSGSSSSSSHSSSSSSSSSTVQVTHWRTLVCKLITVVLP